MGGAAHRALEQRQPLTATAGKSMRHLLLALAVLLCAAPARAQPADDPVALITAIYKVYQSSSDNPGYENPYSKRLQALLDADAKATPKGDSGTIDWDVFVNGNDWELTNLRITLERKSATRAEVRARFNNFKEPEDMLFSLIREDGRWVVDDIAATKKGGRWTMSKILTHAPDAFPDEKK
jgi:hypothetical protein